MTRRCDCTQWVCPGGPSADPCSGGARGGRRQSLAYGGRQKGDAIRKRAAQEGGPLGGCHCLLHSATVRRSHSSPAAHGGSVSHPRGAGLWAVCGSRLSPHSMQSVPSTRVLLDEATGVTVLCSTIPSPLGPGCGPLLAGADSKNKWKCPCESSSLCVCHGGSPHCLTNFSACAWLGESEKQVTTR